MDQSDSTIQKEMEVKILKLLEKKLMRDLNIETIFVNDQVFQGLKFDGVGFFKGVPVLVEICSRSGVTSSSRDDKIISDASKLLLAEKRESKVLFKFIVTISYDFYKSFDAKATRRWQALFLESFGIIPVLVELDAEDVKKIVETQKMQDRLKHKVEKI